MLKARLNRGHQADLYHLRESRGSEIDLLIKAGQSVIAVEVKSGTKVGSDFLRGLRRFRAEGEEQARDLDVDLRLVYGGDQGLRRTDIVVVPWSEVPEQEWGGRPAVRGGAG